MNHMKQALDMRRGKGIDLTIILGSDKPMDEENKNTDMAPENKAQKMEEMPQDPEAEIMSEEGLPEGDPAIAQVESDEDPYSDMIDIPEAEKMDLMGRKPRSLQERAMQNHMMKSKK